METIDKRRHRYIVGDNRHIDRQYVYNWIQWYIIRDNRQIIETITRYMETIDTDGGNRHRDGNNEQISETIASQKELINTDWNNTHRHRKNKYIGETIDRYRETIDI